MSWFGETHGPRFELLRHFLLRMFDTEISPRGEWSRVAVGAFSLALPAGILLLDPPYAHRPTAASAESLRALALVDEVAMLTFLMAVTGVLALLAWHSLFPSRRDYLALAGMPVRSADIFGARFLSVAILGVGLSLVLSLLPSVLTPHAFTARVQSGVPLLQQILARAIAAGMATLAVFFAITALQGILVNLLPAHWFRRASGYVQGTLIALLFITGLQSWSILGWRQESYDALRTHGSLAPPVWFAGLHHTLSGNGDPFYAAMAGRALVATSAALLVAVVAYVLAYRRYRTLLLESKDVAVVGREPRWNILGFIARDPRREAILHFICKVLSTSRVHRLILMGYAGGGLAVMVNAILILGVAGKAGDDWRQKLLFAAFYWPIGLSIVGLAGVRHAFQIPVEWRANWMFRINESAGRRLWMSAVERFVTCFVVVPIAAAALPVCARLLGWPWALRVFAFQLLIGLMVFEFLFGSWQQLPFTCTYVPGRKPLAGLIASWIAVLGLVVPLLARLVGGLTGMWEVFAVYFPLAIAGYVWLRKRRRFGWGQAPLLYEDRGDAVADLGIREMSYRGDDAPPPPAPPAPGIETPPTNPVVSAGLGICRSLVSAYPRAYQETYGGALLETTEDVMEPTWRRDGVRGLARLLFDIAIHLPAEHFAELRRDTRFGLRTLARSPGFTAVALVSLSLGIGVATCAYSEVNGLLHDLTGVPDPDQLVALHSPISYPTYEHYRQDRELFSSTFAYVAPVPFGVSLGGQSERTWGHLVTTSYFSTLGVFPRLGRFFDSGDDRSGHEPVVVVSSRFWEERLGADLSAIGKSIRINGQAATIIGVGPKQFLGASPTLFAADLWLPLNTDPRIALELAGDTIHRRDRAMFQMVGRLRPGITDATADAKLNAAAQQLAEFYGDEDRDQKIHRVQLVAGGKSIPLRKQDIPFFKEFLMVLGGLLLLIACSNIANLMLARASERRKEIAVRLALGAGRGRLVRQSLTESVLLASGAAPVAFVFSVLVMRWFSRLNLPLPIPITLDLTPDWRALVFTFAVTALTGVAFGLAPALRSTRTDIAGELKEGRPQGFLRHRFLNLRNLLVVGQMAASLMLLLMTGYMGLGIQSTLGAQEGFDPKDLYLVSLDPVRDGYSPQRAVSFFEQLRERLLNLPAIASVCLTDTLPASTDGNSGVRFSTHGHDGEVLQWSRKHVVGRGYFETAGIPIVSGRAFDRRDEKEDSTAVVVSQEAVRRFWHGVDPVGRKIELSNATAQGGFGVWPGTIDFRAGAIPASSRTFEVAGVARDVSEDIVASKKHPAIYFPLHPSMYAQPSLRGVTLMIRAHPGVDAITAVRREVAALDSTITTFNARAMTEHIAQYMSSLSAASWTYGFMGFFGLVLAAVGLAGVTAHSVARRGHEMGIRLALGAQKRDILGLILKEGALLVLVGTAIGLSLALAGIRGLSGMFFTVASVQGYDPLLLVGGPVLLAALALLACYLPARRSTRIDPLATLRAE